MSFPTSLLFCRSFSKRCIYLSSHCRSLSSVCLPIRSNSSFNTTCTLKITITPHSASILRRFYSEKSKIEKPGEIAEKDWSKEYHTIPNYITVSRIFASPLLTYAVIYDFKMYAFGGVLLFGFTDWLDGYLAKKLNQQSTIGAFLDPLADKVMIGSLTLGLLWKELIPFELGVLIVSRDVFLALCSIVLRYIDKPSESGFWDVSSATFRVVPTLLSKVNTAFQFALLAATMSHWGIAYPSVTALEPLWWLTATTTMGSWIGYLDGSGISYLDLKEKAKIKAKNLIQKASSAKSRQ